MNSQPSSNRVGRATPITAETVTQRATSMPIHKYGRYEQVDIPDRTWPDARVTKAPGGCPPTCATATRH